MQTLPRKLLISLLLTFAAVTLSACGNKGPLFIPQSAQDSQNQAADSAKSANKAEKEKKEDKK